MKKVIQNQPDRGGLKEGESFAPQLRQKRELPFPPRLLNAFAAAQYLSVSDDMIRSYVQRGLLPVVRLPSLHGDGRSLRRILIDRLDLDRLIERNKESDR